MNRLARALARILKTNRRCCCGGEITPRKPGSDEQAVTLSLGWVQLPPEAENLWPAEFIEKLNQGKLPDGSHRTG